MNLNHLTPEEIISYIESGVIENVAGDVVLQIILPLQQKIKDLETEAYNYDTGWADAIDECISRLGSIC